MAGRSPGEDKLAQRSMLQGFGGTLTMLDGREWRWLRVAGGGNYGGAVR